MERVLVTQDWLHCFGAHIGLNQVDWGFQATRAQNWRILEKRRIQVWVEAYAVQNDTSDLHPIDSELSHRPARSELRNCIVLQEACLYD